MAAEWVTLHFFQLALNNYGRDKGGFDWLNKWHIANKSELLLALAVGPQHLHKSLCTWHFLFTPADISMPCDEISHRSRVSFFCPNHFIFNRNRPFRDSRGSATIDHLVHLTLMAGYLSRAAARAQPPQFTFSGWKAIIWCNGEKKIIKQAHPPYRESGPSRARKGCKHICFQDVMQTPFQSLWICQLSKYINY